VDSLKIKLSASSLATWADTCQVRWALDKIAGLKEPFSLAAAAGQEVHARLEHNNIVPGELWKGYPVGDMAAALQAVQPEGVLHHEQKFDVVLDGINFHGVMDMIGPDFVADWKTTSRRENVKSLAKLENDIQRLLYAQVAQEATKTVWIYGVWKELKACDSWREYSPTMRPANIDREKDRERFKLRVLKPAEEILALSDGTDPLSLVKNKKSCGLYPPAGCPHKNRCFPPTMSVSMATKKSKLFDTLVSDDLPASEPVGSVSAAAPVSESARSDSKTDTVAQYPIEILFVDCFPLSRLDAELTFSHPMISRASASVADDNGVIHARVIDFNKGMDQLAVQLMHDIKASPVKYLYLETKSKEGAACMQPLMGLARMVVKGHF
jgi:hypothetical protein